jgi:hypothetical protein
MSSSFKPVAYIKEGCPYSMKLLGFIEAAKLTDRIDVVRCAVGTPEMDAVRKKLASATHESPKFPTVELEPGKFQTESEELIRSLSEKYGVHTR